MPKYWNHLNLVNVEVFTGNVQFKEKQFPGKFVTVFLSPFRYVYVVGSQFHGIKSLQITLRFIICVMSLCNNDNIMIS